MSVQSIGQILNRGSYGSQIASDEWCSFSNSIRANRKFCECCKQAGKILQVHHLFYEPDRKLWEYADDEVIVLCENCHKELHTQLKSFRKNVFRHLSPRQFQIINGALLVGLTKYDPLVYAHALAEFTANERLVENHAKAWEKTNPST